MTSPFPARQPQTMIRTSIRPSLRLFVALWLALPSAPQSQGEGEVPALSQLYPGPLGQASFGKVVAGEFNGDLSLDAIVLDGAEPVLMVSPEVFDSAVRTGLSVNDIAVLEDVPGDRDLLVTVSAAGLELHRRDSPQPSWDAPQVLFGALSAWADALAVRVADLDGDGDQDLAGLASNAQTVLTVLQTAPGVFAGGPSFACDPFAYDLQLFNWTEQPLASGSREIAVLTPGSLQVFDASGTLLTSGSAPGPMLAVPLDDAPDAAFEQRLVVVTRFSGRDWLTILGHTSPEGPFDLGPSSVVSLATGNVDFDDGAELFLGTDAALAVIMLDYSPFNAPTFDVDEPKFLSFGPADRDPAWNSAGLVVADFDDDGLNDVLAPAQGDVVPPSEPYGTVEVIDVAELHAPQWADLRVGVQSVTWQDALGSGPDAVVVEFREPPTALYDAVHDVELQVIAWRTPDFGSPTEPQPYQPAQLLALPSGGSTTAYTLALPAGYDPLASPDVFSLVARQVVVDANDDVLDIGPAWIGLYTSGDNWDVLENAPEVLQTFPLLGVGTPNPGGVGGGPRVPPTEDDDEPQP